MAMGKERKREGERESESESVREREMGRPWLSSHASEVEQPSSSLLPECPYMAHIMTNMMPAFSCRTWLGAFQHWCAKPTLLFGWWWFGCK